MNVRVLAMMCLGPFLWAGERLEVQTKDGLLLGFQANGAFETLRSGAASLLSPGAPSGIWVHDVQTGQAEQFLGHAELGVRQEIGTEGRGGVHPGGSGDRPLACRWSFYISFR